MVDYLIGSMDAMSSTLNWECLKVKKPSIKNTLKLDNLKVRKP